jgi:hypothetical protein
MAAAQNAANDSPVTFAEFLSEKSRLLESGEVVALL